jgi:glutathione S-transferase
MTPTTAVRPAQPIKLYSFHLSGHSHRVALFLSLLDLPFESVEVDLTAGVHKTEAFVRLNVFGQVPVIDDGGVVVPDSNAILVYLASRYDEDGRWLPRDPVGAAAVQRWLSVAAGPLASGPSAARVIALYAMKRDPQEAIARAHDLFAVMERVLAAMPFLTGSTPTIADLACYTYVAHAPEGGVSLERYDAVRGWLRRIEALPRFRPMAATRIGLVA